MDYGFQLQKNYGDLIIINKNKINLKEFYK